MANKSIHAGHRMRIRERYMASGFENFSNHEILEMLMFYGIPRKDTNELAHDLINKFGSLSAVLEAPVDILKGNGVPENAAILIKLIFDLSQSYINDKNYNVKKHYSTQDVKRRILDTLINADDEKIFLVLYDTKGVELFSGIISENEMNWTDDFILRTVELCIKYHATSVIIAHNNLSGIAFPSAKDVDNTIKLSVSLSNVSVKLNNHYIVGDREVFSMAHDKDMNKLFN